MIGAGGSNYHQLVESVRVDGRPRQKVLVHLGAHATVDDALKRWPTEIKRLRRSAYEAGQDLIPNLDGCRRSCPTPRSDDASRTRTAPRAPGHP